MEDQRSSHGGKLIEGWRGVESYIIIDDFVQTGRTVKRIVKAMGGDAVCNGVVSYTDFATKEFVPRTQIKQYRTKAIPRYE